MTENNRLITEKLQQMTEKHRNVLEMTENNLYLHKTTGNDR